MTDPFAYDPPAQPPPAPGAAPAPLPPMAAHAVPAAQQPSHLTADGRPTAAAVTLPRAIGEAAYMYDLDKARPYLVIDGVKYTRHWFTGLIKVPMTDGSSGKLQVRARVPGYPTVKFNGYEVYTSPKPPASVTLGYFAVALSAALFGFGWFGPLVGAVIALGAAYGAAAWLRAPGQRAVALTVLLTASVILGLLGVFALWIRFVELS